MTRSFGFGLLWLLVSLLVSAPLWLSLPEPSAALALDSALRVDASGEQPLSLPAGRQASGEWTHFRLRFTPDETSGQYLFVPVLSQRAVIHLNGAFLGDTEDRSTMLGVASSIAALLPLPTAQLREGSNVLDLRLQSVGPIPAYLSTVYVGSAEQLAPYYRVRVFVLEYLKLMVVAGQILMALAVLVVWLYRPGDALFGWLTLLMLLSLSAYVGTVQPLLPQLAALMPWFMMLGSSSASVLVVVALLIAGRRPPRWLRWACFVLPLGCMALALLEVLPEERLVLLVQVPLAIVGILASLVVLAWAAVRWRVEEAWLLLLPLLMAFVTSLHDIAIVQAWIDGPVFLSVYYRPLLLIGFAMILMRRLAGSLNRLDDVNAWLTQRLAAQERELERLHAEEKRKAAERIRGEERQRLTNDLHDGLSGHLVSIIALSERENVPAIERSAREALDDLRLVIHSLDVSEDELPLALSGLRERLERQLKRLGVRLDWSIARLPEITGVTPAQALSVLRILQEAVTNAIRHGRATRISVRGSADEQGRALITVENDGLPFRTRTTATGSGLNNMRRRVGQLGGVLELESLEAGTRLRLILPRHLPPAPPAVSGQARALSPVALTAEAVVD